MSTASGLNGPVYRVFLAVFILGLMTIPLSAYEVEACRETFFRVYHHMIDFDLNPDGKIDDILNPDYIADGQNAGGKPDEYNYNIHPPCKNIVGENLQINLQIYLSGGDTP